MSGPREPDASPVAPASPERSSARRPGLALVLVTLVAYVPALGAGFIWDDDKYLTENPELADLAGLARIWVPGHTPQYYPAVFTTFWLEEKLFGLAPAGYHAVNVLLHAANALLVWRLARRLALPGAWFLAAAFALHPVHVESVAWVTERKNVLSALGYLGAMLLYLRFEEERGPRRWLTYGGALLAFVLALLAKTVTCSLPAALILVFLWQQKSLTLRRLAPLAPMFALGFALALHTVYIERTQVGADGPEFDFSPGERVLIASRALLFYPVKLLVPWPLVFVYPRWELAAERVASYWPTLVVLAGGAATLAGWRRGRRGPALALAFYAGTVFPALGFVDVYPMRYSFVADHFQYLASLGVLALVVGTGATRAANAARARNAGAAVLLVLGALTWRQTHVYADAETLWRATIQANPRAWMAHGNLAKLLSERGENEAALASATRGLEHASSARAADQVRLNRALVLGKLGRYAEALEELQRLHGSCGGMELRIAQTLERLERDDEAEGWFRRALETEHATDALVPFGVHLLRRGRPEEALPWLERFAAGHADDASALMFLSDAYAAAGRLADAIRTAELALRVAPGGGDARMSELIRRRLDQYAASADERVSSE